MWTLTKLSFLGMLALILWQASTPNLNPVQTPGGAVPAPGAKAAQAPDTPAAVAPTQTVLTVRGICDEKAQKPASNKDACATEITREQFENLVKLLYPDRPMTARGRQNVAQSYAESLALETAARKSGLEDTDEFRELLNVSRLRVAAELYRRKLQEKYGAPSKEEVDTYYQKNIASYERVKLSRILIPRRSGPSDDSEFDKKALEAATNARQRAAKGDDPAAVQKDAYTALGLNSPPPTELGKYARANFTEKEGPDVFALKAGEATQVETEPRSYVIYKVESRETLPEAEVQAEISREIAQQRFKEALKAATDASPVEFNEKYFGPGMNTALNPAALPALPPTK